MRDTACRLGLLILLVALAGCQSARHAGLPSFGAIALDAPAILICEQASGRVVLMDSATDWSDPSAELWAWDPAQDPGLSDEQRGWFSHPSDAKPVRGGSQVLTVASGGGVALVDVASQRALWARYIGGNPHSATLMPGGRVVVVSSTGNLVVHFHPQQGDETESLYHVDDAHGAVWDHESEQLWVLGGKEINLYYDCGEFGLEIVKSLALPVTDESVKHPRHGGHDLTPIPGEDAYFVSDMDHLWRFDPHDLSFTPLPQRHAMANVKSISQLGEAGPIIVLQTTDNWWAQGPITLDGSRRWTLPGARIYKARWWQSR